MISERKYKEERNKVNMKKLAKEEFNKSLSKLTEQCSENQTSLLAILYEIFNEN